MNSNDQAVDKLREFGNSKEFKFMHRIDNITIPLYFLERSYEDFMEFAVSILDNPLARENHPDNSAGKRKFMELIRLFFNYTTSASALVDSSRKLVNDLEKQNIRIKQEYEKEVKHRFINSPTCQLIKGFRNMISHEIAPEFSLNSHFIKDEGIKFYIAYSRNQILEHIKLNIEAKKLISSIENIDICILVHEHCSVVNEFNHWFIQRVKELLEPTFKIFREKQIKVAASQNQLLIHILLYDSVTPRKVSIEYILSSFFPDQQRYIISLLPDDKVKFIVDELLKQNSLTKEQLPKFESILRDYFANRLTP